MIYHGFRIVVKGEAGYSDGHSSQKSLVKLVVLVKTGDSGKTSELGDSCIW